MRSDPVRFVKGDEYFEVTLEFQREGVHITGVCSELGIGAFGDDEDEAESALVEAVVLQLEAHEEEGDLKEFLCRNGVAVYTTERSHWNPVKSQLLTV